MAGGGILPDGVHYSDADALDKVTGSFVVVRADTAESVWEYLKKDPFYTSGEVVRIAVAYYTGRNTDFRLTGQWNRDTIRVTSVFLGAPKVQ